MKSIRTKIWVSIFGVAAVVVAAIWAFQLFLLQGIYMAGKKQQFTTDSRTMIEALQEENTVSASSISVIQGLAKNKSYYVLMIDAGGNEYHFNGMGETSVLKNNMVVRDNILNTLRYNQNQVMLFEDTHSSTEMGYYICGAKVQISGQDCFVLTETALAPVGEAIESTSYYLIWISAALLIAAAALAVWISRSITRPVKQLSAATKEMARGNLMVQVQVRGKDELAQLAEEFNVMSKEVSKASALQRELVANVSHDIRTPLTMIKGYAETIKDLTGDDPVRRSQQLDIIVDESNRLNVLVNDILDLSRLQAGQQKFTFTEFDMAQKVRDIVGRYSLLESEEGYTFSLSAPEHCVIYADEVKIEQVFYNILNNAVNHTGADKKIFIILDDSVHPARVRIRDTGKGIAPEDLPLIWDRYYKPYKKDDRKGMGTGLGLSIVKAILEAHRFAYGVDSAPGAGSTFWFELAQRSKKK